MLVRFLGLDDSVGSVEFYVDPTLGSNAREYARLLNDLDQRGLLVWSQAPKVQCYVFVVARKKPSAFGAYLRMIIDCRLANRRFREPPNTVLASPESVARMESSGEDTL